jgi:hypothetical protein
MKSNEDEILLCLSEMCPIFKETYITITNAMLYMKCLL